MRLLWLRDVASTEQSPQALPLAQRFRAHSGKGVGRRGPAAIPFISCDACSEYALLKGNICRGDGEAMQQRPSNDTLNLVVVLRSSFVFWGYYAAITQYAATMGYRTDVSVPIQVARGASHLLGRVGGHRESIARYGCRNIEPCGTTKNLRQKSWTFGMQRFTALASLPTCLSLRHAYCRLHKPSFDEWLLLPQWKALCFIHFWVVASLLPSSALQIFTSTSKMLYTYFTWLLWLAMLVVLVSVRCVDSIVSLEVVDTLLVAWYLLFLLLLLFIFFVLLVWCCCLVASAWPLPLGFELKRCLGAVSLRRKVGLNQNAPWCYSDGKSSAPFRELRWNRFTLWHEILQKYFSESYLQFFRDFAPSKFPGKNDFFAELRVNFEN